MRVARSGELDHSDPFQFWNVDTLVVWNKACFETCVAFKAAPHQPWTYMEREIDLNGRGDAPGRPWVTGRQLGLPPGVHPRLITLFGVDTLEIVMVLEKNAKNFDYLDKLAEADRRVTGEIAGIIKMHWGTASNELTMVLNITQGGWGKLHGAVALGMYMFYEHIWQALRDLDGFNAYEFRLHPLVLVRRVFLEGNNAAVPFGGQEFNWAVKEVGLLCMAKMGSHPGAC